ncbi:MAG: lipoyl(octanoyl) transferase LipB [Chitinophagaceae bacterium]|nr:MAG: lipoyl(octanoyl) transferase LipB [Chitinophagaceae bacterium]
MNKQDVIFKDLGQMAYREAWDYQEQLLQQAVQVKAAIRNLEDQGTGGISTATLSTAHHLLFVEHPPVYTLGKSGDMANVLLSEEEMTSKGISFYKANRGGDITFHGPQQLVGYPILDLEKYYTDIGKYLRNIEEVIILTLGEYGILSGRSAGETGVWIDADKKGQERKICAIGVRSSRWVTMHGFALNVNTDLSYFDNIIPCGIKDKQVTSIEKELGHSVNMEEVKQKVKINFEKVFESTLVLEK